MIGLLFTIVPALLPGNVIIALVMLGLAYAAFTLKLQRKLSHPSKTREIQAKIKALTKEMNEMAKRKEDISAKQAELMPLVKKSMSLQMKSMFVVLPLFFLVYYGAIPTMFAAFSGQSINFIIPMNFQMVFFVTILVSGLVGGVAMSIVDKRRTKVIDVTPVPQQT